MNLADILGRIGFDWQVALANVVNFLIIFALLKYFAFKPLAKIIAKRKAKIQDGLDKAQAAETALQQAQHEHEEVVAHAKQQANEIVAAAQSRVDTMLDQAQSDAEEKTQALINEAHVKIEKDRKAMERAFRAQAAELIVQSVSKVLDEELTKKKREQLLDRSLELMRQ